jgi:hypothetical protein
MLLLCCAVLQELYFRRTPGGRTDWQWSYNTEVWFDTDDLAPVSDCLKAMHFYG